MKNDDLPLGMVRLVRNYSTYTMLLAGLIAVWSFAGWGFPFVMAKDYKVDKDTLEARLTKIESAVKSVSVGQLEAQELTLIGRQQDLEREIARVKPSDPIAAILVTQKSETEQSLRKVRTQLRESGVR